MQSVITGAKQVTKTRKVAPITSKLLPKKELPDKTRPATTKKKVTIPPTAVSKVEEIKVISPKTQSTIQLIKEKPEVRDLAISTMVQRGKPRVVAERIVTNILKDKEVPPPEVEEVLEEVIPLEVERAKPVILDIDTEEPKFPLMLLLLGGIGAFMLVKGGK